ncbi:MAG: hypothetical protein U5R14_14835 [Gemmatimonadota bacterium]|nr:hypothetical protein [Gemmatimonadota bacterium]
MHLRLDSTAATLPMHLIDRSLPLRPSGLRPAGAGLLLCASFVLGSPRAVTAQTESDDTTALQNRWPDSRERTLRAHRRSGPITLDGRLDEADWEEAPIATGFVQEEPFDGRAAMEETEVRVLYDDEAVYVGALLRDSDPSRIASQLTRRDETGRAAGYLRVLVRPQPRPVDRIHLQDHRRRTTARRMRLRRYPIGPRMGRHLG